MASLAPVPEAATIVAVLVNTLLGAALGALLGGLHGAQVGLVAGMVVALLPLGARFLQARFGRRDSLLRFVARQVAQGVGRTVMTAVTGLAAAFAAASIGTVRQLARPQGLANLTALLALAGDATGAKIAWFASLPVLVATVLVLLASQYDEAARRAERR